MKLIVAGSTGFVATEVIRQALSHPAVTSIVALARRETPMSLPTSSSTKAEKLKPVVCNDFGNYPESVKRELAGADACIWLIAVTPSKSRTIPWDEVRRICLDYTMTGLETISQLPRDPASKPLRFVYTSGANAERDQSKKPWVLGDYCLMRGEVESRVLAYAQESQRTVKACVAKPGLIYAPGRTGLLTKAVQLIGLPIIDVREVAAALLNQAVRGLEKDTLLNEDLVRIGRMSLGDE